MKKSFATICIILLLASTITFTTPVANALEQTEHTLNITATTEGEIIASDTTYEVVNSASSGSSIFDSGTYFSLIHTYSSGEYYIGRGFLVFNTTEIPENANITSAILKLKAYNAPSPDFNITVQNTTSSNPHTPLIVSDYDQTFYAGNLGTANTSEIISKGDWFNITLNTDGLNYLNSTGETKFCLRCTDDINGAYSLNNIVSFYDEATGQTVRPQLYITYTIPDSHVSTVTAITDPANTTITGPTVDVEFYVSSNDTIVSRCFNVFFSNGTSTGNITYTGATSIIVNGNGTASLFAYVVGEKSEDSKNVSFSVLYIVADEPEPTPTPTPTPTATSDTQPDLTIISPFNRTYMTDSFNVEISYMGQADLVWFNVRNGSSWVYDSNITYSGATVLTGFIDGSYTFMVWASNSLGESDSATVLFTIGITANPVLPQVNFDSFWLFFYEGDYLGFAQAFLVSTFLNFETAMVLVVMLFVVPVYLKTKSLMLLSILWLLLGGFFVVVLPAASALSVLFVALGIGGLAYRLFRPSGYG
jgi:hypothetical protein